MTIKLNKPFAANAAADEDDVRAIKRALNWLGYYTPYKKTGLSTVPDGAVFEALRVCFKNRKRVECGLTI